MLGPHAAGAAGHVPDFSLKRGRLFARFARAESASHAWRHYILHPIAVAWQGLPSAHGGHHHAQAGAKRTRERD